MHKNLLWVFFEKFGASFLSIVVFFVYAYLLSPYDMGVAITILSVTQFIAIGISTIFEDAIVQAKQVNDRDINTAFSSAISISGLLILLVVFVFSVIPFAQESYNMSMLVAFASFEILLTSFSVTYVALLRKEGKFKTLAFRVVVGRVGGALCGLIAILNGLGAWAIVAQSVLGMLFQTIILVYSVRSVPSFSFHLSSFKRFMRFGVPLTLKRITWDVLVRSSPIIAGLTLGTSAAGHVGFAWRVVDLFRSAIFSGLMSYLLPHYSRLSQDKSKLSSEFLSTTALIAFFVSPIFMGLLITAPVIVTTIFESKWYPAIPLIQLYSIFAIVSCWRAPEHIALTSCGNTKVLLREKTVTSVVLIFALYHLGQYGLWIFGCLYLANFLVLFPIGSKAIRESLGIKVWHQILPCIRYAAPSFAMVASLFTIQYYAPQDSLMNTLVAQISLGIFVFSSLAFVFYRKELRSWKKGIK